MQVSWSICTSGTKLLYACERYDKLSETRLEPKLANSATNNYNNLLTSSVTFGVV